MLQSQVLKDMVFELYQNLLYIQVEKKLVKELFLLLMIL